MRFGGVENSGTRACRPAQHAEHLRKRQRAIGHVADSIGHGDGIVAGIGVGDGLRVDHFEVDWHAVGGAVFQVHARHVEHLGHQIGALDVRGMLGARHGEGDVAGAARDIEHVVGLLDGRLFHHALEPQLVGAEARDGVEALVLLRDLREDALHAFR